MSYSTDHEPTSPIRREPATMIAAGTAIGVAVLDGLLLFGFDVRAEVAVWLTGTTAVLAPLIAGVITRAKVYSPAGVDKVIARVRREVEERRGGDDVSGVHPS